MNYRCISHCEGGDPWIFAVVVNERQVLLHEHRVTLPGPEKELLIAIRTGKYTQHQVFELADDLTLECQQLLEDSDLRDGVDVNLLSPTNRGRVPVPLAGVLFHG